MPGDQNKVAIVTGGTRGIGRAIVESLLGRGYAVAFSARNAQDVERVAGELGAGSGRVLGVPCDVRDPEACQHLVDETVRAFGRLDVLVNNAGVGAFANVADMALEDWKRVLETNLDGVFYCCRAAIPHLRDVAESWIINIGSLAGRNAFAGGAAYNASKFGLLGFSEALMLEVRHDGIRVSTIMPGSVATTFGRGAGAGDAWKIQPEDIGQLVLDLLDTPARTLPSKIEVRPSRPPQ
jgi:NAD(P)-dependent dehydrogenase (short-subunit alcohol dehydrogenase family)